MLARKHLFLLFLISIRTASPHWHCPTSPVEPAVLSQGLPMCSLWFLWPLPSMALMALTVALLAMTVATTAYEVKPLDMALDSFDDQYQGCGPAMKAALPALNHSEFQNNPLFAKVWARAVDEWQGRGSRVSPLSSPAQAIAIMAYTMDSLYEEFNGKVRVAGHSHQAYRDNFHFKTLHFLLTDALATLRDTQAEEQKCHCVLLWIGKNQYKANIGDTVRFGQFVEASTCGSVIYSEKTATMFEVQTCHGVVIPVLSEYPTEEVLIPPFEKFKVTKVNGDGKKIFRIQLKSIGTYSKYNCQWLTGGSVLMAPCLLRGLLLATTFLKMATGIL